MRGREVLTIMISCSQYCSIMCRSHATKLGGHNALSWYRQLFTWSCNAASSCVTRQLRMNDMTQVQPLKYYNLRAKSRNPAIWQVTNEAMRANTDLKSDFSVVSDARQLIVKILRYSDARNSHRWHWIPSMQRRATTREVEYGNKIKYVLLKSREWRWSFTGL